MVGIASYLPASFKKRKKANFQFQLQTQLEGSVIGSILEREQLTNIRMIYPNNKKTTIDKLKHSLIFLPDGKLKPITGLADINIKKGISEINRENLQSMGVVSARLNNRDLGSVIRDIQKQLATLSLPPGYQIVYGGSYAQQQQSFKELLLILIVASLLVFTVILFLFKNFKIALLIIVLAVLGTAGSFLALFITNTPLNVGSYTGIIMIVGIIGENAIFTILQLLRLLENNEKDKSLILAVSIRLRPNLMTALGAILALIPLALGLGTGAQMHQPLAIAVIGGFIMALPLLLIVLPSMLRFFYR